MRGSQPWEDPEAGKGSVTVAGMAAQNEAAGEWLCFGEGGRCRPQGQFAFSLSTSVSSSANGLLSPLWVLSDHLA